jgi:ATP-binding cassette subfamily C protein
MGGGHLANYTVEADVLAREQRGRMGDAGVVAQRYELVLFGNAQKIELQSWRTMVGYVPQELILFHASILENLTLSDEDHGESAVEEALRLAGADEFVANLPEGVHTVVGSKGARLSGGQRQRIALARALIRRPRLCILDEVTSALDPESEREICRNIMDLRDRTTVLAVTHRPAFLDIATRVYQIEDGSAAAVAGGLAVAAPA